MWLAGNAGPFVLHEIAVQSDFAKGLKILHVSDLHMAPGQNNKQDFLAELATLRPDLVVNTGDNLGHKMAINPALKALEPLLDLPGVFVNGSNDYRAPKPRNPLRYFAGPSKTQKSVNLDTGRFVRELEGAGWLNLNNQAGTLSVKNHKLGFLGLDDPHENLDQLETLPDQARSNAQTDITIGVAHAPYRRVIDAFLEQNASLIFAGHTHGGQICLPGQRALVTNCDLPTRYASGLSAWEAHGNKALLHVSNGLGCSIYQPVRLFCPPSATLISLV